MRFSTSGGLDSCTLLARASTKNDPKRWATEDPNPTQKVAEKRRLEEIGQAAISAKLDPRMVDAVRSMRALEDGDDVATLEEQEEEAAMRAYQEQERDQKRRKTEEITQGNGLLSAEALDGLKFYAEQRQKQLEAAKIKPAVSVGAKLGLGGYSSGEDD